MGWRTPFQELRRKVVLDTLEKFPDATSRSLARKLSLENPGFFKDFEQARTYVRLYRGQNGSRMRINVKMRKYFKVEV